MFQGTIMDTSFSGYTQVGEQAVSSVKILSPTDWTCKEGQYCPEVGAFYGDFDQCPLNCSTGHYGAGTKFREPSCSGPCPVGHYCLSGAQEEARLGSPSARLDSQTQSVSRRVT